MNAPHPLRAGPSLPPDAARSYRLRAIFDAGKIDPQVADTSVLAPFPLLLQECNFATLRTLAERLATEALDAERELLHRPDLHRHLALPRDIRRALAHLSTRPTPAADAHPRLARLDFHWATTPDNPTPRWIVSEINADVPGGLIEAGALPAIMQNALASARLTPPLALAPPPDPAAALARAIRQRLNTANSSNNLISSNNLNSSNNLGDPGSPLVALVHATAFADDRQVMDRLARALSDVGLGTTPIAPDHLAWTPQGQALDARTGLPLAALARFYPAEWLPSLVSPWRSMVNAFRPIRPASSPWLGCFTGQTPMTNPAWAVLTQSKRWALLFDRLDTPLPTWRSALPETRDPRQVDPGLIPREWVLKPALGRVGEGVLIPGLLPREARAITNSARKHPRHFIAQRRFESLPLDSPLGPIHVALGVYVVDGQACGLYARAAGRPLIDQTAWELPVLLTSPIESASPIESGVPGTPTTQEGNKANSSNNPNSSNTPSTLSHPIALGSPTRPPAPVPLALTQEAP